MNTYKTNNKHLIALLLSLILLIAMAKPAMAQISFTQEEKDYIAKGKVITAASIDGGAPHHYRDSKGKIVGIAVSTLDKIGEMTGLIFEYELYQSIEDVFSSNTDIIFGLTPNYAPQGMVLSDSYLKSETILAINSSVDANDLENKRYASIKGGSLPEGVREENTTYYDSREATLNAVEKGEVDYTYGNEYSIAFYTLQDGYKNIVSIPNAKESREYSIGFNKEVDPAFISIINKSIDFIDDGQMNHLILEVASRIERKISFPMFLDAYGGILFFAILIVISSLSWGLISNINTRKELSLENKKHNLLGQVSNEYLFEYHAKTKDLSLSKKCRALFGREENIDIVIQMLKDLISDKTCEEDVEIINLPLCDGNTGVFKAMTSCLYNDDGKVYYIIGKLINITEEAAEKEKLIIESQIDGLTGLYNAITTRRLIDESIKSKNSNGTDAFILIDCDDFKDINDSFGHLEGDRALKNVSKALKANFREIDIIGRIGGDEFCVYLKDIPSIDQMKLKCEKVIKDIQEMDRKHKLSVSVGISFFKDEGKYEDLFKKADDSLYEAKRMGGGKVVL